MGVAVTLPLDIPAFLPPPPKRYARRRPQISAAFWSGLGAFIARERHYLAELKPTSPRIRPTSHRLCWMDLEPGAQATEMGRAA